MLPETTTFAEIEDMVDMDNMILLPSCTNGGHSVSSILYSGEFW